MKIKTKTSNRATSIDVARLAGVSQSTVSRTFSAVDRVSTESREKVLTAASELGYKPNVIARSLITQRTNIVGVVMADFTNPFYTNVLQRLTQRLHDISRQVLLFNAAPDQDIDDMLPLVLQHQVDAIVITSATLSSEMADECARLGTPVILFNRYVPGANASAVSCDNVAGGRMAADVLLDAGYQRMAYIAGIEHTSTNVDRERGFSDRLRERGQSDWLRESVAYTYESGYDAARRLLERDDPPEAIFAANDNMALGVLDRARELGITVPDELAVIGHDDIPAARRAAYSLTTIRQPVNRMIEATMELLVERIEAPEAEPVLRFLPTLLIKRNSVRAVEGGNDE